MFKSHFCSMDFVSKSWTDQNTIMFYGSIEPTLILTCSEKSKSVLTALRNPFKEKDLASEQNF